MNKKFTVIAGIGVSVVLILLFGIWIIIVSDQGGINLPSIPTDNATQEPETDPDTNQVDLEDTNSISFEYTVVLSDGSVRLRNNSGEEEVISLINRNWRALSWSPDKSYLAMLGGDSINELDLYLYSIEERLLERITFYTPENVGVSSYVWKSNNEIYFASGVAPDNWLHEYSLEGGSVRKLERVDGRITAVSEQGNYFIYQLNGVPADLQIRSLEDGTLQASYSDFGFPEQQFISELFPTLSESKFIMTTENFEGNALFKASVLDNSSMQIEKEYTFNPVCALNEDAVIGYIEDELPERLSFVRLDTKSENDSRLNEISKSNSTITEFYLNSFICDSKNFQVYFRAIEVIEREDQEPLERNVWYEFDSTSFEKADPLVLSPDVTTFIVNN